MAATINNLRRARLFMWATLPSFWGIALAEESQKLFAAPTASQSTTATGSGSLGQATLALALVLAAVFSAAWLMRKLRRFGGAAGQQNIEVLAQAVLGSKERAVLLKIGGAHVLVGVAPGRVNLLHVLDPANVSTLAPSPAATSEPNSGSNSTSNDSMTSTAPSFKALLKQSLGLK